MPRAFVQRAVIVIVIAVTSGMGLYACRGASPGDRSRSQSEAAAARTPAESEAKSARGGGKDQAPAKLNATPTPRKIIRNGEVRIVVKVYEPARRAIEGLLAKAGGHLSSATVDHRLGRVSSATLVLRIPSGKFGAALRTIAQLGTVIHESIRSRDVTAEYFDLQARLNNSRKLEKRLLELLDKQTGNVKDLLQVERELSRVRSTIERFEGKLRLFDNLVGLSTLTVRLQIREKYVPPKPPTLGSDVARTLADSWDTLASFGRGLLLAAVALLPWLLPIGIVLWLLWRGIRRLRRPR